MGAVRISARARVEIAEALEWYLTQSSDASAGFLTELDLAMKRISEAPEHCPVVRGRLRRVLLHSFPYAVYYKVYPTGISVVGVIHGRRHPRAWIGRAGP